MLDVILLDLSFQNMLFFPQDFRSLYMEENNKRWIDYSVQVQAKQKHRKGQRNGMVVV